MLDQDFCEHLEYALTEALGVQPDEALSGFWCDGVMLPTDYHVSARAINERKEVLLTAFVGADGQQTYQLRLCFGPEALSRYNNGQEIKSCIPTTDEAEAYSVDPIKKMIVVQLH